jgi:salicylate hydroxylase
MGEPVLIIGAGIGGLSAALALRQIGFDVQVYERADEIKETGAGLTLTENGSLALDGLGLKQAAWDLSDTAAVTAFIHYKTGEVFHTTPAPQGEAAERAANRVIHRSDMHAVLLEACKAAGVGLVTGAKFIGFDQDAVSVTARFANGSAARGAALIGADGLRSVTRAALHGETRPNNTGKVAWRSLIPTSLVEDLTGGHASAVHFGPGATFVRYTVRHGAVLNCVAIVETDIMADDDWSTPSTNDELKAQFAGWDKGLLNLIDRIPQGAIYKWPLFDRDPISQWTFGRVTLLGDAAHPMLPFLGIGASMAIEDALVLRRAVIEAGGLPEGLARYERARVDRAAEVVITSREQGKIIQGEKVIENFSKPREALSVFKYDATKATV